ncbi:11162_t:CDS:2 [Ambispora leptoticha]|uniref:11162_t:CDS:1 n=1 Tax=Ambispora leptoticha TaxID=144679 RepID=A0A9N8ZA35_9GLOM|nr:11162_t:CDS:2 [Ambispora leptoticha]
MVKFTAYLVFLFAFLFVVASADYEITNPTAPTVWHKGSFATIRWLNLGKPDVKKTVIALRKGDPANLDHVMIINPSINANKRLFRFRVPKSLPAGNDYVLQIGEIGKQVSYSHPFTISD